MTTTNRLDPITLTVIWDGLRALCDDVGYALQRTAYSAIVRDAGDCAAGIFDRRGRNIAQGVFSPGHLGGMTYMAEHVLRAFRAETLAPGDAIITNDIYIGAGQLQDTFVVSPVFEDDALIGFVGSSVHLMDVGGASPGSQAIEGIFDNFQEGLRIPLVKLYDAGEPVVGVHAMIMNNVRFPEKVAGDLRAMINANHFGAGRLTDFFRRYGAATMEAGFDLLLDDSEARMREAVAAVPDGTYSCDLQMDDYGPGTPPIDFAVDVTIIGDDVVVDWSRSSSQVAAGINSARSYSFAYSSFTLKCLLAPEVPWNEGCLRAVTFEAPVGCFMNPKPPAPGAGRSITVHRHFETIVGALGEVLADRAIGASSQWCNTIVGGEDPDTGKPYLLWDILMGGFAGRSTMDGPEALASVLNSRNIPTEVIELENPVRVERHEFVTDTCGAGEFRGSCAVRKDIRFLGCNNRLTPIADRHVFPPHGIHGGGYGALAAIILDPHGAAIPLHSKGVHLVPQGEVVRFQVSGSGGYGDPKRRDPAAVEADVLDGFVTPEEAARLYGAKT